MLTERIDRSDLILNEKSIIERTWTPERTMEHIRTLPIWDGDIEIEQKFGGLQNRTFFIKGSDGEWYVARVGVDELRTRQTTVMECTIAAYDLGVGPRLIYAEPNLTITEFVHGTPMEQEQMSDPDVVARVIDRVKILHSGAHAFLEPVNYWWVFNTVRRFLSAMETGKKATNYQPAAWAERVPELRQVTNALEKNIDPFYPCPGHNDMAFVNMIFNKQGEIMFIDWDGGGFSHPMWDIGEYLMWADASDELIDFAVNRYYPEISPSAKMQKIKEIKSFQVMAAIRLVTEVLYVDLDPYYFLTPEEMTKSMELTLPGETPALFGLAEYLMPRYENLWSRYKDELFG